MSKRENAQKIKQLRVPALALLCAVVTSLCAMLCTAMLMERGVLGAGDWGLYARLCLAVGSLCGALYICLRIERNRLLMSAGVNVFALMLLLILSYACETENLSYGDLALDIILSLISAVLVCMVATKRTKRKKSKKLHK